MGDSNILTTIDIGSSKIRTLIGYFDKENSDNFSILGVGIANSNAIRKGNILDMEEFKKNLDESLTEAEKMAGEQVSGAYISFNSSSLEVFKNKTIISVSGSEVTNEDIDRAIEKIKSSVELANKEILKIIPESFTLDLEEGIKNPIGMTARKLELIANIFAMNLNILTNIRKAVNDIGIEIYDIYPNLISSPEGVLSKRQKELGVVCIDIGSSTTGMSVYENGVLIFSKIIPVGGDNVTNDIALGLRISTSLAEQVKLEYGDLDLEHLAGYKDSEFILKGETQSVSKLYLSKIISARYEEIFYFVVEELRKIGKDGLLPEGAVCVGACSKIKGFVDLAKKSLRLPVFIGLPASKDNLVDYSISDPVFSGVLGSMIFANLDDNSGNIFSLNFTKIGESFSKIFKKIFPK